MKIVEELKSKKETPKVLSLPEHKEIPTEVNELQENYFDKYGINNTTAQYIREKKTKLAEKENEVKQDFANNEVLKNITSAFGVYTLVSYKSMDEIAKDHNLHMSGLGKYNNPIPQDNLQELDTFTEYLGTMDESILKWLEVSKNSKFIFKKDKNFTTVDNLPFDSMFYIMAPKSHINIGKDDIIIGREISESKYDKPKFTYEFKVNLPEPKDPIIFFPFKVLGQIYCVIITAWDEVADDLRIRKLI